MFNIGRNINVGDTSLRVYKVGCKVSETAYRNFTDFKNIFIHYFSQNLLFAISIWRKKLSLSIVIIC